MADEVHGPTEPEIYYRVDPYAAGGPRERAYRVVEASESHGMIRLQRDDDDGPGGWLSHGWWSRNAIKMHLSPTPLAAVEDYLADARRELVGSGRDVEAAEALRESLRLTGPRDAPAGGTTPHGAGGDHGG